MERLEGCAFCTPEEIEWRTIREGELFVSFVSKPWFREKHCLVVPKRHIDTPSDIQTDEGTEIMGELARLSGLLDEGFGTGIMQKYQPTQAENGIKVHHTHFHIFPRLEDEVMLFPVPEGNSFDGFYTPTDEQVLAIADSLK